MHKTKILFLFAFFCIGASHASSSNSCQENPLSCLISKSTLTEAPDHSLQKNVLQRSLGLCSTAPLTGYFRNGYCQTDSTDGGVHTVCAEMTDDFLIYSKSLGNDLITPHSDVGFPGLKAGQRWCLCAARWKEANLAGHAPGVILSATHQKTLDSLDLLTLQKAKITKP